MGDQPDLFDLREAVRRRDAILDVMEDVHVSWVEQARSVARDLARKNGTVVADDVRKVLYARDCKPDHFNAWGAVFRASCFEWTGTYARSAVIRGKGNMQRVWRLK